MRKHKYLSLILTVIMVVTAVFGMSGCGREPIAEIPDPQYFFQNTHDELNEHDDVKQVILRSDQELWTHAAAYVNLLKYSGKYEFVSFDEELYPSGDYMWNFKYNGSEEVKDAYFAQIEINYYSKSNGRDVYAVWITLHDLDNFELVENDIFDPDNIYGTEAYVPETEATESNADYFQTTPTTTDSSDWVDDDWDSDDSDTDWAWEYDNDDLYDADPICGVCDGDGDCGTCGGDGLLHSSASDEEDRNCYSCSGSGNCRSCGGDGEL